MTREELYNLVWSTPASTAAVRLGISDVYLGRVCRSLDVPKPPRGYWRRRAVGQVSLKPALPDARPGLPRVWTKGNVVPQPPDPRRDPPEKTLRLPQARSRKLTHGLVREAAEHLRMAEPGPDGYLRPRQKKLLVDIITSRDCLPRSLRFASDLFHALEARGHCLMIAPAFEGLIRIDIQLENNMKLSYERDSRWSPLRPTVAYIYGLPVGLSVIEACEIRKMRYIGEGQYIPEKDYRVDRHPGPTFAVERQQPTGKVKLVSYSPFHDFPWIQDWSDTAGAPLSGKIEGIVTVLEGEAIALAGRLEKAGRYFQRHESPAGGRRPCG